jgi:peroxiredoxin
MKRMLSGVISAGLCLMACNGHESASLPSIKTDSAYAIIGKVTGQDNGTIYIEHRQTGKTDSAALDHGFFKFSGKADTAEYCRIRLNDQVKGFFLENGKISMLIKKDSLSDALISGTPAEDEYNFYQLQISKSLNNRMTLVDNAYAVANSRKNKKAMDSLEKVFDSLDLEQKQLIFHYTKAHPASVISAFLIYSNFIYNPRPGELDSLYHQLDTSVQATYFGKLLQNSVAKAKLTAIGSAAPVFSCADASGKPVSLSSFKGKYVLLDFWASWCGPCRRENPTIAKAYRVFHDKGFDIFGVSLDDTKADWLNAIKKDGLDWTQVSDLKGWQSEPADLYGIKAIPMNYLLDKTGIIVAKGLRGDALNAELQKLIP